MLIRWSYRRTTGKMVMGKTLSGAETIKADSVTTWRVLWVLCIPVFAIAVGWEKDR